MKPYLYAWCLCVEKGRLEIKLSRLVKVLLPVLLIAVIVLPGCGSVPRLGWAGTVVSGDTIYIGTMDGTIRALNLADDQTQKWQQTFGTGVGALYGHLVEASGYLYATSYSGRVYKLDVNDGSPTIADLGSTIVGGVEVSGDTIFVGTSEGILYALDTDLGVKWQYPAQGNLGQRIWSTPKVDGNVVYFGCFDNKLYALDVTNGDLVWNAPFQANGAIASKPLIYGDMVYFGSFDRNFYAVNKNTGVEEWRFKAGNWFWSEAIQHGGNIYVGSLDKKLYMLDATTGQKKGERVLSGQIVSPPLLAGDVLIVGSKDGKVYGLTLGSLANKWVGPFSVEQELMSRLSTYHDGERNIVYVYGRNSILFALNAASGAKLWELTL